MKRFSSAASLLFLLVLGFGLTGDMPARAANLERSDQTRTLTFADRVAYQRAIEEVYWRHRIWPKGNTAPKPSLDEVMPMASIERKVEDYLSNCQLLADWKRPITAKYLQGELDRMAQQTRNPDMLRELFAALGNDPFIIAECLARPELSEHLVADLNTADGIQPPALGRMNEMPPIYTLPDISGEAAACSDDTWRLAGPPGPRIDHTVVWTGSEMIVWGGSQPPPVSNTGARYNPATNRWTPTSTTNAPAARKYHKAVWTGSEMIVWGGSDGVSSFLNSGGKYDPITDSWTPTSTINAPVARVSHTAVWTGSEMVIWGGADGITGVLNTGGKYNPSTNSWSATSVLNAPDARSNHTAVWTASEMIVWGGRSNGPTTFNDGGRYNPSTNSWTAVTTINAPAPRSGHTAVWTGSEMIVWSGGTGGRYNPDTGSWTATSTVNAPAVGEIAIWTGSEMIVWGGSVGPSYSNAGGRYNPTTDSWGPTSLTNAPPGRSGHTAVWTGSEMIIWGGDAGGSVYFNSGGRYDPGSDSWTGTNNAPEGRYDHTAIWTGVEMIVWGGQVYGTGATANTGGKYNPTTDNWAATNTTNAPTARAGHTAVWTGREMIIWGGSSNNTGGKYNPLTDTWTATSTMDAPTARSSHTAVWTGDEMIIWGGGFSTNTGGRYNTISDSWTPTSTTNAAQGRSGHAAVWTGREMIIWGGSGSGGFLNSGGKYDPSTDSWSSMSDTNSPIGRSGHSAVWTGDEMIVWGGSLYDGQPVYLNSGGKYNPITDNWAGTTASNAPSARDQHTAVWTGAEMIIWGGYWSYPPTALSTGGRYNPSSDSWTITSTTNVPSSRYRHTALWTGTRMIVWGGYGYLNTGGMYCAQPSTPIVQSAGSRKTHGGAGSFDVDLPLSGTAGIECRSGGPTNDYTIVITFLANVSVDGNPQAVVISGDATIGSGGIANGGNVIISGNVVKIPLTNVANAQTISVKLSGINGSTDVTIPMSILAGDVSGNGVVNASDVSLTKSQTGQTINANNFRSDVNASGSISASDVSLTKSTVGTALP